MRTIVAITMGIAAAAALMAQAPEFTKDNQLIRPANYREWVFLSSGLGMTYGPAAEANRERGPMFDNVFVNPAAYQAFVKTGQWPDKTILVLEIRSAVGKGSINNGGHFQGDALAIEAEIKDSRVGGWAFY